MIAAFVAALWLALIMIVSSMTLLGPSFKKTCPYTVTMLITVGIELLPRIWEGRGYWRWLWIFLALVSIVLILLQMLAFSLDPHSSSIFTIFRPFRIEVLTLIQPSSSARSSARNSIV